MVYFYKKINLLKDICKVSLFFQILKRYYYSGSTTNSTKYQPPTLHKTNELSKNPIILELLPWHHFLSGYTMNFRGSIKDMVTWLP